MEPPILNDKKFVEKDSIFVRMPTSYKKSLHKVADLEKTTLTDVCLKAISLYAKSDESHKK